jgi:hypothetical protein
MANVVVSGLATWNGKALKKAQKDLDVFQRQINKFAKVFGVTFSATALVAFSKKAVKAFAEDEVAAKSLQLQLENTGNAFRVTEVEAYIKSLEKTYAILTDLRAPFQTLLNVTGSVELAQRSLEAALDISAGTGQSLANVVGAISAGVRGQTRGIKSLNTGIDENILATGDMNKIMEELEKRFSGQAAARLDTYAGKMDVLKKSSDEASKIIGESLVDALMILSKDNTVENLSSDFEDLALAIADTVRGMAKVLEKLKQINKVPGTDSTFLESLPYIGPTLRGLEAFRNYGAQSRPSQPNMGGYSGIPDIKVAKQLLNARKKEFDIINKKNAIENKNLEELKKKFDLERIGLNAALNSATDEETKLRLRSQLAILDNNEALAKKLLAELETAEALKKLAEQARLAGMTLEDFALFKVKALNTKIDDYLQNTALEMVRALNAQIASFIASLGGVVAPTAGSTPTYSYALSTAQATNEKIAAFENKVAMESTQELNSRISQFLNQNAQRTTSQGPMDIRLTIDGGSDKLSQAIAESIQVATRSGYSTIPAGFIV